MTNMLLKTPNDEGNSSIVQALATGRHRIQESDIIDETLEGIIGGTEAIGHALTNLAFHLAREKQVTAKLRQELRASSFHPDTAPSTALFKLPYLVQLLHDL